MCIVNFLYHPITVSACNESAISLYEEDGFKIFNLAEECSHSFFNTSIPKDTLNFETDLNDEIQPYHHVSDENCNMNRPIAVSNDSNLSLALHNYHHSELIKSGSLSSNEYVPYTSRQTGMKRDTDSHRRTNRHNDNNDNNNFQHIKPIQSLSPSVSMKEFSPLKGYFSKRSTLISPFSNVSILLLL